MFQIKNAVRMFIPSLFLLFISSLSFGATAKTEIVMGFNPAENADVVETNSKLFSKFYKEQTGLNVKTFIATDYTALIEALRSGQIDFAWLPPFSFIKAEQVAGAEVLLKAVRKGKAVYYSAIITRSDKNIHSVEDLKGKNIAWVDPSSVSGHIFPKANLMKKKGIDPDTFFGKQVFSGAHDALVLAVLNGTVDAGATYCNGPLGEDGAWMQYLTGADVKKIRVLFVTDPITGDTLATSKKFKKENKEIVDKTVAMLLAMGKNEEGKKILKALYRIDSMVPATSKEYDSVREAAKLLHID